MEPHSESEPSLRTTLLYSRMTASAVREALAQEGLGTSGSAQRAHPDQHPQPPGLPAAHGGQIQSPKKTQQTDAIFANLRGVNDRADADAHTLRISIDTKATVHVGDYSRGGRSRAAQPVKALDHDMCMKQARWCPGASWSH